MTENRPAPKAVPSTVPESQETVKISIRKFVLTAALRLSMILGINNASQTRAQNGLQADDTITQQGALACYFRLALLPMIADLLQNVKFSARAGLSA